MSYFPSVRPISGTYDKLFDEFSAYMAGKGLVFTEGKIIDASFVEAPRQHNTREENKKIKDGEGDDLWKDNDNKRSGDDLPCVQCVPVHTDPALPQRLVDKIRIING